MWRQHLAQSAKNRAFKISAVGADKFYSSDCGDRKTIMKSDSRMLARLLTVSLLILVETSADVLVQPGYHQPGLNQGHQRRQDSSQQLPQQYFQQQQQWQRRDSSNPYQSPYTAATNAADPSVSTSLVSPFLLPSYVSPFGGIGPAGRLFSLGPLGLQSLRFGSLGGYGLPLLGSPHSQSYLAARSQFPRSTDRQLEAGAFGHEKRNDTISSATWKNDDVASKSSMKPFSESERRPAFPISQVNNINERTTSWKGNGKSDHQIVGGSLLDPLGLIEKTENAIENFGEHLSPTFNPIGVIGGTNSHSSLPAPPEPYLWRESDNSQIQQTQNAPQNVPLGSPGNPKGQTKQSPLLGSRANSTDSQASTLHQESYRPTSYKSALRESSPSNPVGSPSRLDGDPGGEKQRYRVDSSGWPYRQRTLENPRTYQDGSAWKNGHVAQGWDSVGDRTNAYRGNTVKGQSYTSYPSNPIGRTHQTAVRDPYAGAASPFYGNPSYGYNKNANAKPVTPSRTVQNRQFGGTQQRPTAVNYPAEPSYGSNHAEMAASRRENIPAQYTSASQGRTSPLFQDYEYSRPFYGYGNRVLPGGFDRFGSSLSPPFSAQAWLPRPYSFYNDHVFDDIADFSYRSYRPTL